MKKLGTNQIAEAETTSIEHSDNLSSDQIQDLARTIHEKETGLQNQKSKQKHVMFESDSDREKIPTAQQKMPMRSLMKRKASLWTSLKSSLNDSVEEDALHANTGYNFLSVPPTIRVLAEGGYAKYSSDEIVGSRVVKLKVYEFDSCLKKPKKE
ncbi:hypothetical protein QAD02_022428 [Eretmocerus hayati]|uniref:Uncharacterized protein n=1 Tax=Eretmocerus hayati TaxID=131215 RepID=A0ACC2PSS4_9HYME|nr:hypothetical protein QAD02_022428 [Eretmocerus hayati]